MGAAAEWADISPFPRRAEDGQTAPGLSVTNLSWEQRRATMASAPLFGGRREWDDYSFETTGFGSVELRGPLAHRITIVHPDDPDALRRHHQLVRSGRLKPALYQRRLDSSRLRVIDRDELIRTRADTHDSWLVAAQHIARLCGLDDEVARIAGPALRQLLWVGRPHLDSTELPAAFADLRRATEDLAVERRTYLAAVDRWATAGPESSIEGEAHLRSVAQLAQGDVESIQLEIRVLAEVQREWEGSPPRDTGDRD